MTSHIMPTYGRLDVTFTRGEGAWLWDKHDKRYLDALSGIAVCSLGHAHPAIHTAISTQSQQLLHTSNLYNIPLQEQLATKLCQLSGMDNVFFGNSGAEANEAAIKIARLYGHQTNIANPAIIVMQQSFHGRTMATLSATGNPKVQDGFAPLLDGFIHVAYNDIPALKSALAEHNNIVAILVEPIQGEGGVNIPASDYLNKIRDLCDSHDLIMMLDEVQTGIARTGAWFAFQHNHIIPDVCTLAKALGNGVPIGACMAKGKASKLLTAGKHGSTYGGNPLACSAALAVLETIEAEQLCQQAETKGNAIHQAFSTQLKNNTHIKNIRNKGMMIGIELDMPCTELVGLALDAGLLINVTGASSIRLLPPLIINDAQIALLIETLSGLINSYTK
ncbi:acetylornithine/N-succinyldiaminopimelate aminotransferase [Bathymodiolus japonicus methanotrophic gill symbiont]|uniref:aspartate aminotransferase family protein n=1 Tax=Bathymodiolus japonicus methanotrophic gill symbiont TaxID=113269 RepID=UPI001B3CDE9D|nr:aspartate aminotransferase family protein [Bathymodiolus japonicus methanotrophic gill symbiont]GFO71152.1 acetylornithine/N-succinyldiaminopimelate aminotransferase [Bathymodiolus japonicus methanotrophic gill symbiont]